MQYERQRDGRNRKERGFFGNSYFVDSCEREVELPKEITAYVPSGPLAQIILYAITPEELAAFCERVYDRTLSIMEKVGDNKVKGIFVVGEDGLSVLAKSSYQAETFDLLVDNAAVVDNPVSKGSGNEVTMEQISLWNPDFVLFGPMSIYDTVKEDDSWKQIQAVAMNHYIEVPEGPHNWMGSPPAVQQYLGLIWLTAELYPEYCDYDVKEEIMEYYRLFYHCELTEEQYNALTEKAFLK